jgi:transcriptional regulator of acetoin/glycerol metabolism
MNASTNSLQSADGGSDHYSSRAIRFFDSMREKAKLFASLPAEEEKPARTARPKIAAMPRIKKSEIIAEYKAKRGSMASIAANHGLSESSVFRILAEAGIKSRKRGARC